MTILSSPIGADYRPATAAAVTVLANAGVPVHLPGTEAYTALTGTSNLTKAIRPVAVVPARDAADISRTVRVAAAAGLRVGVQSTGHGATETMQDAILVSTAALDELTVHADERWARIGAGVRWAAVLEACAPHGLAGSGRLVAGRRRRRLPDRRRARPGGPDPRARVRHVRAFEVVTGDGVARRVTATDHPELFWGLRGGKGTLGIVTAVEIDLIEQAELYAGALWFAGADAAAVVRTWSRWCERAARGGHHVDRDHAPARPGRVPRAAARHDLGLRAVRVDG